MSDTAHRRVRFWLGKDGTDTQKKLRQIALDRHIPISRCAAVMLVESGGRHDAISPVGAVSLMQVMPCDCAPHLRHYFTDRPTTEQLKVPCINVAWGCLILLNNYLRWGQDWDRAHAAYYGGITPDGTITDEGQHYVDLVNASIPHFEELD